MHIIPLKYKLQIEQSNYFQHSVNDSCSTHEEVRLIEVVGDIPANLAVLASLLHHSMEECQHIHQAAEGRVWACCQGLMGDFRVCGSHVQFETVGRLCHYLHTILHYM